MMKYLIKLFAIGLLGVVLNAGAIRAQSGHTQLPVLTTYVVGGQVIDSDGKPGCSIRVCAFAEDFDESKPNVVIPCATSDDKGNFLIIVYRTGRYKLFYDQAEQGYWSSRLPFFRQPFTTTPEVVVNDAVPRGPITITLAPKNGLLVGKSIDVKTGLPVDTVEFTLCHAADPQICHVAVVKSADGQFKVPAPFVPFTLRAKADGFSDWFGLSGSDKTQIELAGGTSLQLDVLLTRQKSAANRAISESEKQPGLHLPAPVQSKPADGIVFDHYPRATKIEWLPVPEAVSYSVEVDYCKTDRRRRVCVTPYPLLLPGNPPMTGINNTSYEFNFVGAQPGRWRVWAVDKDGREGFKSAWRTFVYLQ